MERAPVGEDRPGILARGAAVLVELGRCDEAVSLLTRETEVRGGLIEEVINKSWRNLPFNDGLEDKDCTAKLAPLMADRYDDPIYNSTGQLTVRLRAGAYLEVTGQIERGRQEIEAAEQVLRLQQGSLSSLWESRYKMLGIYRDTPFFAEVLERYSREIVADARRVNEPDIRGWVSLLVRQGRRDLAEPIIKAAFHRRMSYSKEHLIVLRAEKRWKDLSSFLDSPSLMERELAALYLSKDAPSYLLPYLDVVSTGWGEDIDGQNRLFVILSDGMTRLGRLDDARAFMGKAVNGIDDLPRPIPYERLKNIVRLMARMGDIDQAWALVQKYQSNQANVGYMPELFGALGEGAALAGRWDEVVRSLGEISEPRRRHQAYSMVARLSDEVPSAIRLKAFHVFVEGMSATGAVAIDAFHFAETAHLLAKDDADVDDILSVALHPAARPKQRFDALVHAMDAAGCAGREDVERQLAVRVDENARSSEFSSTSFSLVHARALLKAGLADTALRAALANDRQLAKLWRLQDIAYNLRPDRNSCGVQFRF